MSCEKDRSNVELRVMGLVSLQSPGVVVLASKTVIPFSMHEGIAAVYNMSSKTYSNLARHRSSFSRTFRAS